MQAAILTDTTKCIGCRECVIACKRQNNLAPDLPHRWDLEDGLSARNWTSVLDLPGGKYVRKHCRHCLEPACVSACPVGALRKTDVGAVIYDGDKCMGCRYCMMSCPFGVPRYDWDQTVPYVRKCILCYQRLIEGGQPACTEACPAQATVFGERSELIALAHGRLQENPGKYVQKIWGEQTVGGTSVMYISDIDLTFLTRGEDLGSEPIPERTKLAMNVVPFTFVGVVGMMAAVNWVIERRRKLEREPEPPMPGTKKESGRE